MPGLGNPMQLDVAEFNEYWRRVGIIQKIRSGDLTDRDLVEMESGVY